MTPRSTPGYINAPDGGYETGGYRELAVPADLRRVAEVLWTFAPGASEAFRAGQLHRVLPETGTSLCFKCVRNAQGVVARPVLEVMGPIPSVRLFVPRFDYHHVGVRLRSEWCTTVLGVHPAEHLDAVDGDVPTLNARFPRLRDALARTRSDDEAVALLAAAVGDAWRRASPDRSARLAHAALEPMRSVPSPPPGACAVSARLGITERHLRRVVDDVGAGGMKTFHRVRRLHHAVSLAGLEGPAGWSQLALRAGFYDQAHMIREFRALAGVTPVALHAERAGRD